MLRHQSRIILFIILILPFGNCTSGVPDENDGSVRIELSPDMLTSENGEGDVSLLIDEQGTIRGNPKTFIDLGTKPFLYPAAIIVDLKDALEIGYIDVYISEQGPLINKDTIKLFSGQPFDWQLQAEKATSILGGGWTKLDLNKKTSYLRIAISSKNLQLFELKIYGKGKSPSELKSNPTNPRLNKVKFRDFIGVNAFATDPIGLFDFVGWVREYHNWIWSEKNDSSARYPNNLYRFNKAKDRNFDLFYANLHSRYIDPAPAFKENIEYLRPKKWMRWSKPILKGEDPLQPGAYVAHAAFMYQYAARYGSHKMKDELLKLDNDQERLSGLDYIKYYENWNEENMTWKGEEGHFSPFEFAAMSSADYDGHLGSLPGQVGIKNADPNAKLVMGGVAGLKLEYVKSMKLWVDQYRRGDFPFQAINFHFYAHQGEGNSRKGTSPEGYDLKDKMLRLVKYRDKYLPNTQIWISEFGYDTTPDSPQGVPASNIYSSQELQAIYLLRTYLILFSSGIDRAAMYMLRDVGTGSNGLYASSGLTEDNKHNWKRKTSWYYLSTLSNWLGQLYFDGVVEEDKDGLYVYRFKSENGNMTAYALWNKDEGTKHYDLDLPSKNGVVREIQFKGSSTFGDITRYVPHGNKIGLEISEKPILIVQANSENDLPQFHEERQVVLDSTMISNARKYDRYKLVDEQKLNGNMLFERVNECKSLWANSKDAPYPIEAVINLKGEKDISRICFNDKPKEGDMEVYYGEPGKWKLLFTDHLKQYNGWSVHSVDIKTQYLKIVQKSFGARVGEMAVYERIPKSIP